MFTTLKQGPTVPDAAFVLSIDLEARGFRLYRDGSVLRVTQGEKLTAEDRAAILKYKLHLLSIVDYVVKSA
jgi:hypothetical protein